MRWSWRLLALIGFAAVVGTAGVLTAQNANDLPAAPSEVVHPKPAAPKTSTPPDQQLQKQPDQPAQNSEEKAAPQPGAGSVNRGQAGPGGESEKDESDITIPVVVNEVSVIFTVTDRHNHYVKDLNREELKVIDDARPVPEFRFRRAANLPLQVGLLIDASNSIRKRLQF